MGCPCVYKWAFLNMQYSYRYINCQIFDSSVCYTLLIENSDTREITRIEKSFKVDVNSIDDEFLRSQAIPEIDKIIEAASQEAPQDEVPPEEALSDG